VPIRAVALLFALFVGAVQTASAQPRDTLISDVTVIDGLANPAVPHQHVLLQQGRIASISDDPPATGPDTVIVDGRGRYLIPGLWDLHAHTFADETAMQAYLTAGVTGLRDMGCSADCARDLAALREAYRAGSGAFPRLVFAGPMLDGDSPYDDYPSHLQLTLATLPGALDTLRELDVDFIKTRDFLSRDEFMALVGAGAAMHLQLVGHVPTAVPVGDAVRAGLATVEHEGSLFGGMLLACSADEGRLREELLALMSEATASGDVTSLYARALGADFLDRLVDSFDPEKADALVDAFVESGAAIVPTLIVQHPSLRAADPVFAGRRKAADEEFREAPETLLERWRQTAGVEVLGQPFSDADRAAMARHYALLVELLGRMHAAGVPILAGTDAIFPDGTPWMWSGFSLHDELQLLVSVGLSTLEALAAATGHAARMLGLEDVGVVAPGLRADLVLLSRDPLAAIHNTRAIERVWVNGETVDREALLEHVNRRAADHANYWD
jgi:imidazolonepropionase-like amidohydrolase